MLLLQPRAQWRLDFVSSENSMGFHAPPEVARILAESIDYSRQAQVSASTSCSAPAPSHPPDPANPSKASPPPASPPAANTHNPEGQKPGDGP